jgi:hypothetical protein
MSSLQLKITSWGEIELDKREMRSLMRSAGNDIKTKTARLIGQSAGSGRVYRGGRYRASAPGAPPIRLSGALRNSLRVYTYKDGSGFAVRERQFYALFLEAGARGGGPGRRSNVSRRGGSVRRFVRSSRVLAPRPHLDRVMQEEAPELDRRIRAALDHGLKWRETK